MLLHDENAAKAFLLGVVEEELVLTVFDADAPVEEVAAIDGEHVRVLALVPLARPAGRQKTWRRWRADLTKQKTTHL